MDFRGDLTQKAFHELHKRFLASSSDDGLKNEWLLQIKPRGNVGKSTSMKIAGQMTGR
jgi:hypothetical protein